MKPQGFTNSKKPSRQNIKQWREQTRKAIDERGRMIIGVMANEGSEDPMFTYCLGNHLTQDGPELLTFYPSNQSSPFVINNVSDRMRDGEDIQLSETEATLIYGCLGEDGEIPVRARLLTQFERVIAWEKHTCQLPSAGIPVAIIDLPDPNGKWPEDDDCLEPVKEAYANQPFKAKSNVRVT